jgi:hypothetical protein
MGYRTLPDRADREEGPSAGLAGRLGGLLRNITLVVTAIAASALLSGVAPEPSPIPRRWQLDLTPGELRMMRVEHDGELMPYFYLTYTVVNNSGEDVLFAPLWEMAMDNGDLIRSGRDVPLPVVRHIIEQLENPFLESQVQISGPLLQGEENAKDGIIVWPIRDFDVDEIKVYAAGFSGETATIEVPDPQSKQLKKIVLRKTLELTYTTPGDLDPRSSEALHRANQGRGRWVMR